MSQTVQSEREDQPCRGRTAIGDGRDDPSNERPRVSSVNLARVAQRERGAEAAQAIQRNPGAGRGRETGKRA